MRTLLLLLSLTCCVTFRADAQQGRPTRVSVMVALGDRATLNGAPFRIVRRADTAPHDIILIAPEADARALSEAIGQLQMMRRVQGDTATTSATMRVRRPARAREPRTLPWAPRVIQDLRRAETHPLPGIGTVKSVQIWLPATRTRRIRA